ncbi:MAG: hypothetical protein LH702_22730 [Phormidesmis sp. CAN_BIN44]|nr:hypothetical protein [Phormidesmis sp. CAN_BIN44]
MQFSTVLKTQRNGVVGCHMNNRSRQNKSLEPTADVLSVEVRDHLRLNPIVRG